jgi:uncharacterized protein (TIGR00290 family)
MTQGAPRSASSADRLALAWSSGKDSAAALEALIAAGRPPSALLTTFTEGYERVSMHGVRRVLVERQAAALGLPLVEVTIPVGCPNSLYEERFAQALEGEGFDAVAFGDLFLEDVRAYRERLLDALGREAVFPLWRRNTRRLARSLMAVGFEAIAVCVDPSQLDASFAGRRFDREFLADLPPSVDPCGENGEFHTFVHAGPSFNRPLRCEVGETQLRDGFAFCDVLPAGFVATPGRPR